MATSAYGPGGVPAGVLADVTELIRAALSDYGEWTAAIAPNARLDADLGMQSVELAALQERLSRRWGDRGDLGPLLRTLDLAGLTGLTVTDVAGWVAR
jgi:acyl carrier protein